MSNDIVTQLFYTKVIYIFYYQITPIYLCDEEIYIYIGPAWG
jgi:hypothetical protein